jgi:hypothetical protein
MVPITSSERHRHALSAARSPSADDPSALRGWCWRVPPLLLDHQGLDRPAAGLDGARSCALVEALAAQRDQQHPPTLGCVVIACITFGVGVGIAAGKADQVHLDVALL